MKLKRLVASISASFDDLVSKIENHEAVAEVTLQEIRAAAAKIRTQINLTQQRIQNLQHQEQILEQDISRWRTRAVQASTTDKNRALRCVQALEQCEQQKIALVKQIQEYSQLQKELNAHLQKVELRLADLQRKRDSLSARAACNSVTRHLHNALPGSESDAVFTRWEEKVLTDEYAVAAVQDQTPHGDLDADFRKEETQQHLEDRLANLLADKNNQ